MLTAFIAAGASLPAAASATAVSMTAKGIPCGPERGCTGPTTELALTVTGEPGERNRITIEPIMSSIGTLPGT